MERRAILSIDGGGIRGIIPATVLMELEEVTGKAARETFSFVAGTSTGAIIASALSAGVPARRIRDLYLRLARKIFAANPFSQVKRVFTGSMYSIERLRRFIAETLAEAADWTLNDAPVDLLLTAKRVPDGKPWYFVRDTSRNAGCTGRLKVVDCAVASAAAPTFFPPYRMPEPGDPAPGCETVGLLVDGGVGVTGNPIYEACVEAFEYSVGYSPQTTIAVSLGTGRYTQARTPTWIYPWLDWLLGQLLESPQEQQTEIAWRLYRELPLYRIDIELHENIGLDDTHHLGELERYGEELAGEVDWEAILAGRDRRFRVEPGKTRHAGYAHR